MEIRKANLSLCACPLGDLAVFGAHEPTPSPLQGGERV